MAKSTDKPPKVNNLVAKHSRKFNRAVTMADRKARQKSGYRKHKGGTTDEK